MRKALSFIVIFCLLICLCGCGANFETTVTVNEPTDNSVNGYRLEQKQPSEQNTPSESTVNITGDNVYYANKNSKKFHLSSCGTAKRINEENLYITSDRNELINSGYSPCKSCNP